MSYKLKLIIVLTVGAIFCIILSRPVIEWLGGRKSPVSQTAEGQLRPERTILIAPDQIVKLINPKPSSTIVDLGAGCGLFTMPLSKAVGETGKVFATDTDPKAVAYLTDRAKKESLKNIVPVLVKPDGVDPFYFNHMFDVIIVSDVMPLIQSPDAFFGKLKPHLREESGRLWVVEMRLDPDFTLVELADAGAFRKALLSHRVDSAVFRRLTPEVRQILTTPPADNSQSLAKLVIKDLNRMLDDPTLWPEIQKSKLSLNQREAHVREYLSQALEKAGIFVSHDGAKSVSARGTLRLLNRLVLQDILETYQWEKAFSIDVLNQSQWRPLLDGLSAGQDYPALFRTAGYTLVQEHKVFAYHYIYEFKRR